MIKIWITGAKGHVGNALMGLLDSKEYEIFPTDIEEVDISDKTHVHNYMIMNRPDVIINCAGATNLEKCEKNVDYAYAVNAVGARNLASEAQIIQAKIIQISTDDVFDLVAERPYNEFDAVKPKTIYGKSKLAGERFVSELCSRYVIIRSSWVYGTGNDFVSEVLGNIGKVRTMDAAINKYASPTSAGELAKIVTQFIEQDNFGIYHAVCQGSCNRYEFAKEILKCVGKESEMDIHPVTSKHLLRPEYSVLDNMMLRLDGLQEPPEWKTALKEYLEKTGGVE